VPPNREGGSLQEYDCTNSELSGVELIMSPAWGG